MSRRRMAPVDASWLHMDRRTNRMIVNSVMWFDEPLDWDAVREVLRTRLINRFPRFSERVVEHNSRVWWEEDPEFDLEQHLKQASLPFPGGPDELHQYVSDVASTALPRERPLWEMHFIDDYRGGSAIYSRIHHCIADGVALFKVMLSLTDDPAQANDARVAAGRSTAAHGLPTTLGHVARGLVTELQHPSAVVDQVGAAAAGTRALARLVLLSPEPHTALRAQLGESKSLMWTEPLPLRPVINAAKDAGVTVNDLMLSAISGALRAHLARIDGSAPDVRAVVPINVRPTAGPLPVELGNEFGLLFVSLPVAVDDATARLAEMHRRTTALKRSAEPAVTFNLLQMSGRTPYQAQQLLVDLFTTKASVVVTNVAGPRTPIFLAGRRVRGTIGWPPPSGDIGVGISIISYDGEITIGLFSDQRLIEQPARLLHAIRSEIGKLMPLEAATHGTVGHSGHKP
jgi:diacylglycerol O-acyltransferase